MIKHEYKFRAPRFSLVIPQTYDDTLTYYEAICAVRYALDALVEQLNEGWDETAAEKMNEYFTVLFGEKTTYTADDLGLHLEFTSSHFSGDHKYNPETRTMTILKKERTYGGE